MALGAMKPKKAELVEALNGRFDSHHAELARMLLDQIDALTDQILRLGHRIEELIDQIPEAQPPTGGGDSLGVIDRLDEITGIGRDAAQTIIAETGLDMTQFPTAGHLVSWAKLTPRTIQSGPRTRRGKTGKGNPYLKGVLGEAAASAGKTDSFLGDRYRRLARRRGQPKALVAVARSILVIVWHLLADPTARFSDLGADHYTRHVDKARRTRHLVHQLQALGHQVNLTPAA
jgi:transposase